MVAEAVLGNGTRPVNRNSQGSKSCDKLNLYEGYIFSHIISEYCAMGKQKEGITGSQSITHFPGRAEVGVKMGCDVERRALFEVVAYPWH